MQLLSVLLLAVSTNIDNLIIALNIGISGKKITYFSNLLIALMSGIATYLFSYLASFCSNIGRAANIVGSILIIVLGISALLHDSTVDEAQDTSNYKLSNVIVLGVALSVNCLPIAFAAGLTGMSPLLSAIAVTIVSAACMRVGNYLGLKACVKIKSSVIKYFSGIGMILLGVLELFI